MGSLCRRRDPAGTRPMAQPVDQPTLFDLDPERAAPGPLLFSDDPRWWADVTFYDLICRDCRHTWTAIGVKPGDRCESPRRALDRCYCPSCASAPPHPEHRRYRHGT